MGAGIHDVKLQPVVCAYVLLTLGPGVVYDFYVTVLCESDVYS